MLNSATFKSTGLFICIEHGCAFYFCIHTYTCIVQQIIRALYSQTICAFPVFPFNFSLNKVSICSWGWQPADILILWSPVLIYSLFLLVFLFPFSEKPICFWHLLTTIIFYELPGKNPFRDAVICSVKILHLACLTACNVLTFIVSMPLNNIFFTAAVQTN